MKNRLTNYWNILTGIKNQNENLQDLKIILFRDKTTAESINLFMELKRDFEEELSKRKLEAINENININDYFNSRASLPYTTVKDAVFQEPIQN
jgi:ABC-type uncharacterized transport system substrate-binding protein